ncbi:lipid II flippase Amj family protein [Candidatus Saganbacteria bacterium]|nr:lipid II flippase Amj family protein [Candidatus Saganbacteria bacterium]
MTALFVVCFFTAIIHLAETSSSCLRLAGVRTGRIATALSFVNATLLVSRLSNMFQAPFLGGMVDTAILRGNPETLIYNFRMIIFAAFIGNLLGAIMSPFFISLYTRAIYRFDKTGSVPRLIVLSFHPKNMLGFIKIFKLPKKSSFQNISLKNIPKTFLVLNVLMVSIYAIGVLSSMLAGAMVPEYRVTATQLSAIVNGMATILLTLMVDPTAALITDQAVRGKRPESDVRSMVFYIIGGRILGTLLISQLLLLPAANYIESVTHMVRAMFGH